MYTWVSFYELDTVLDSRTLKERLGDYYIVLLIKLPISGWHTDFNFCANSDQLAMVKSKLTMKECHDWIVPSVMDNEWGATVISTHLSLMAYITVMNSNFPRVT